jgi:hypothetical protein
VVRGVLLAGPEPGRGRRGGDGLAAGTDQGRLVGGREVEQAADGPDAISSEYRPGRAYSDDQWLDTGTSEVQVLVDPPAVRF